MEPEPNSKRLTLPASDWELQNLPTVNTLKAKLWDVIPQLLQLKNTDVITMKFTDNVPTSERIRRACKFQGIDPSVFFLFDYLPGDDGMKVCPMQNYACNKILISMLQSRCCLPCSTKTKDLAGLINLAQNAQKLKRFSPEHAHALTRHPNTCCHAIRISQLIRVNAECLMRPLRCKCGHT